MCIRDRFKFGPTIEFDPASESIWHAAQFPAPRKTSFPLLNNSSALACIIDADNENNRALNKFKNNFFT